VRNPYAEAVANGEVGRGTESILRVVISPITIVAEIIGFAYLVYWHAIDSDWSWTIYFGILLIAGPASSLWLRRDLQSALAVRKQS
jgi:hypothetical protein